MHLCLALECSLLYLRTVQDLAMEPDRLRRSQRAESVMQQERTEQDNLLLKAKVQHAKQLLRRHAEGQDSLIRSVLE